MRQLAPSRRQHINRKIMKNETLTVKTDKWGTVYRFNAAGELHNAHGPAVVWDDGSKEYWINGKRHNPNGPAVIWTNGYKEYWIDGKRHNPHGPAVVWANGDKEYWIDGKLHNDNGPAVDFADGTEEYWINGQNLTESEYKSWQKQQAAKL